MIEAVRARHDGARRNPFDEPEYGHHYARALAAWGAVVAIAGFGYSAVRGEMRFAAAPGTVFWSNGSAWGTCTRTPDANGWRVSSTSSAARSTCAPSSSPTSAARSSTLRGQSARAIT